MRRRYPVIKHRLGVEYIIGIGDISLFHGIKLMVRGRLSGRNRRKHNARLIQKEAALKNPKI